MIVDPQAPRTVTSFIVWQAPSRAYGAVTGYDVRFINLGIADEGNVISKEKDELFHVVKESDLPNQGASINIQVQCMGFPRFGRVKCTLEELEYMPRIEKFPLYGFTVVYCENDIIIWKA